MILGVDISTSITGFAVVADEQIVYYDSIDLRKCSNIFEKTVAIKEKILDLYEMYYFFLRGLMGLYLGFFMKPLRSSQNLLAPVPRASMQVLKYHADRKQNK